MDPTSSDNFLPTNHKMQFTKTINENVSYLTPNQIKILAKRAHQLLLALGLPSLHDLKALIRVNLIRNNQVANAVVNLATKAYGLDIATLKGKSTRKNPPPVVNKLIEISIKLLELQQDVMLTIDGLTVNSLKLLSTISHNLYYIMFLVQMLPHMPIVWTM